MHKVEETKPPPTLIERIEKNDPTLKELAGFGGYSLHRIAAAIGKNQTITSFKLSSCLQNDGDDGCIQLMQAFVTRRSVLKRISLARNYIGLDGAAAIAKFIRASQDVHSIRLDLLQNCLTDEGVSIISDAIANEQAQTIVNIGLEKNGVGNNGIFHISKMLHENNTIHTLRLGKNDIDHDGIVESLAPALKRNTALRVLDLSGNRFIGDRGAEAIANALHFNQTLETLVLTKCSISCSGALTLVQALYTNTSPSALLEKSNHTLRELILSQNPVLSTSLMGRSTYLRDAIRWNQFGVASARMGKLNNFLTSSEGPKFVHSAAELQIELLPELLYKIWKIESHVDVMYSYLRGMPEIFEH